MRTLSFSDPDLARFQDAVVTALMPFETGPFKKVVTVEGQALTTADTAVRHGLGYPPVGWLVVKRSAAQLEYSGSAHADPSNFINLKAGAAVTVTLLFF